VLTGGPGTGKTETVRIIIAALRALKKHYALCAPTGRAAKRLAEATGRPAQTIHRLLEYNPEAGFVRDERDPLTVDYLIVDEASMLDLELAHHLLEALKPAARVLFVGDVNQLPSVGAGDVLRDLIRSGRAAVVQLTTIFRQAADSGIVVNAHRINQGQFPILNEFGGFYFFGEKRPKQAADLLVDIVGRRIPEKFGLYPIDDVQVLAPMYRGACGVDDLNARLQEALNPAGQGKAERRLGERVFRVGDKVMQTRNDYDRMVFNGDVGRIAAVDPVLKEMAVLMPGRGLIHYDWDEIGKLTHAFATTIHKAQGAEYPCVVVPLLTQHYVMLQRNLLYTAITRARRLATAWHHVGKLVSRRRRLRSVQFPGA
ncbi:MAG: ATP-dependent RecD-like DNA helicase, partial [Chloroflexi bacterium]